MQRMETITVHQFAKYITFKWFEIKRYFQLSLSVRYGIQTLIYDLFSIFKIFEKKYG